MPTLQDLAKQGWNYVALAPIGQNSIPIPSDEIIYYDRKRYRIEKKSMKEERILSLKHHSYLLIDLRRELKPKKNQSKP